MHDSKSRTARSSVLITFAVAALAFAGCSSLAAARGVAQPVAATPTPPPSATPNDLVPPNAPAADPGAPTGGSGHGTGTGTAGPGKTTQPNDPNGTVSSPPQPPQPPYGDGALHVKPDPRVKDGRPAAIDHVSIAPDGVTVTVYWYGGTQDCYSLQAVRTTHDSSGTLVITVLEGTKPGLPPNTACVDLAQLKAATITLDEPLFRDGSKDQPKP